MEQNYYSLTRNRWLWLLFLLVLVPLGSWAQNETNYELVFVKADNTEITTPITDEYPQIEVDYYEYDDITERFYRITTGPNYEDVIRIPISELKRITTREVDNTGIQSISATSEITGVYTLEGMLISKDMTSTESLSKGVYVIKKGNRKPFKCIKR